MEDKSFTVRRTIKIGHAGTKNKLRRYFADYAHSETRGLAGRTINFVEEGDRTKSNIEL